MNYPRLFNHEFARGATFTDPAVPLLVPGQYTDGVVRVLPGSTARLQVDATSVTGAGASLSFQVEESDDQATWTNAGAAAVVTVAGTSKQTVVFTKRWARVRITAKAGTTPAATASVNLLLGSS